MTCGSTKYVKKSQIADLNYHIYTSKSISYIPGLLKTRCIDIVEATLFLVINDIEQYC